MYCDNCGGRNKNGDLFCNKCGGSLNKKSKKEKTTFNFDDFDPFQAKDTSEDDDYLNLDYDDDWTSKSSYNKYDSKEKSISEDDLLREFIGKKYESFTTNLFGVLPKNIGVFLFAPFWYMYRKMTFYALVIAFIYMLVSASLTFLLEDNLSTILLIGFLILHLVVYFLSSKVYLSFAKKHVEKIKREYPTAGKEKLKSLARDTGGTNGLAVFFLILAMVIINAAIIVLSMRFELFTQSNRIYFQDSSRRHTVSMEAPYNWSFDEQGLFFTNGHCHFAVFFEETSFGRSEFLEDIYGERRNVRSQVVTTEGINWDREDFYIDGLVVRTLTTELRNTIYLAHFAAFDEFRFHACESDFNRIQETLRIR